MGGCWFVPFLVAVGSTFLVTRMKSFKGKLTALHPARESASKTRNPVTSCTCL